MQNSPRLLLIDILQRLATVKIRAVGLSHPTMPAVRLLQFFKVMRTDERFDWKFPFKALVFLVMHPLLSADWLRYLSHADMTWLWQHEPRLIDKPLRPYLNARWTPAARIEALRCHYDWLLLRFRSEALDHFYSTEHPELAHWSLPGSTTRVTLKMGYCGSFEREGDLTISLHVDPDGEQSIKQVPLLALTLGVVQVNGLPSLCIGCVQARNDPDTRERLALLTKAHFGLRPKSLLVQMAQFLAVRWNLPLFGIDPKAHPFTSTRYQLSARKRQSMQLIGNSYQGLWADFNGLPEPGGWMRLPEQRQDRAARQIPTRKRSMYAKRALLMEQIERLASTNLDGWERS